MKIRIKFDDEDDCELTTVSLTGGCGNNDELAATIFTLISITNLNIDWVLASLLGYTNGCDHLDKAIKDFIGKETSDDDE